MEVTGGGDGLQTEPEMVAVNTEVENVRMLNVEEDEYDEQLVDYGSKPEFL